MQLILESEPTLDIGTDMSAIEEPEKVVCNGDIQDLNRKCNGNKVNFGEGNIVNNTDDIKVKSNASTISKTLASVEDVDNNKEKGEVVVNIVDDNKRGEEAVKNNEDICKVDNEPLVNHEGGHEVLVSKYNDVTCPKNVKKYICELPENNSETNVIDSVMNTDYKERSQGDSVEKSSITIKNLNNIEARSVESTDKDTENHNEVEETVENIADFIACDTGMSMNSGHTNILTESLNGPKLDCFSALDNTSPSIDLNKAAISIEVLKEANELMSKNISSPVVEASKEEVLASIEMDVEDVEKGAVKGEHLKIDFDVDKPVETVNDTEIEDVVEDTTNNTRNDTELNKLGEKLKPTGVNDETKVQQLKPEENENVINDTDVNKLETIELQNECVNEDEVKCVTVDMKTDVEKINNVETIELKDEMDIVEIKDVSESKIATIDYSLAPELPENNELAEQPTELNEEMDVEEIKDIPDNKNVPKVPLTPVQPEKDVAENLPIEVNEGIDVEEIKDDTENNTTTTKLSSTPVLPQNNIVDEAPIDLNDEMDVEVIKDIPEKTAEKKEISPAPALPVNTKSETPIICKLSNTLDILSDDDEEESPHRETQSPVEQAKETESSDKQCINIEDDDDIMVIDEDIPTKTEVTQSESNNKELSSLTSDPKTDLNTSEACKKENDDLLSKTNEKESPLPAIPLVDPSIDLDITEKTMTEEPVKQEPEKPLLPANFLKSAKKNLADMTREDLEEFCILKIVESIVDRGSLSDIKTKLKNMTQSIDEYRKKTMMLTKQNRDLQVVLKSVQEEQKKMVNVPITPLRITRSVGMQVLVNDKTGTRRKGVTTPGQNNNTNTATKQNSKNQTMIRMQKPANKQNIPVPRLVPANNTTMKAPSTVPIVQAITPGKIVSPAPNGIRPGTPIHKVAEKRQHIKIQSLTVDLTDDEPPTKMAPRNSPAPPVRVVDPQNLMAPQRQQFSPTVNNSPRKVYIPISGPQSQNIRTGQTVMLKSIPSGGMRPRCISPQVSRASAPAVRRISNARHPAPLPDETKQYQPPNWKALPPAPDLRLSKVENGIVISWKIEDYQEDSYEEIASYQLYAYQETTSPPSTHLWKKIGDVKALPLPMACTLTQFMSGFKYYFAVRAVDVKSRVGPFSLPGSILLLTKL